MGCTHSLPTLPTFEGKGLFGYTLGPLQQKDLEILYIDVEEGHDTFMVSKRIKRIYYVLSGNGFFTIGNQRHDVCSGTLVEISPKVEYCYSGKMKLLAICRPRWFNGNDRHTKWNPDVVDGDLPPPANDEAWKIFAKRLLNFSFRLNGRLWRSLPDWFSRLWPVRSYGDLLHSWARRYRFRSQAPTTYFLRNRPQLELIKRLIERRPEADPLRVAVLGCSTGVEAYSIAWRIRSARPDLKLTLMAADISKRAVEFGARGKYSLVVPEFTDSNVFERMNASEMLELFDRDGDSVTVKSWIRDSIQWQVGDVADREAIDALGSQGSQDIVIANNFLCHMSPLMAESCLRNIARLVRPCGYLFVSGVDLDVRARVAADLGWSPVEELLEDIHDGDPSNRNIWPFHYAGLEPLNKGRQDWKHRYAATFQVLPSDKKVSDSLNPDNSGKVAMARESTCDDMPLQ
jgi:chemotaxis methyl-accepting protein methylase/mannose-6-phosphate isomerase-like protein (cupin superfamily)